MSVFAPRQVTFDELSEGLRQYEQKYGYSTIEFYHRYQHDDGLEIRHILEMQPVA